MKSRSGAGKPAETLNLLWRKPRTATRGPKPSLTVDEIVDVALRLADEGGIDDLTMRSLAAELQVAPMALYRYVPGRDELIDLMLDTVYARMSRQSAGPGWRARIEAVAHDNYALYEKHPWIASISTTRPPLGPGMMAKYEYELHALVDSGLSDLDLDAALTFVLSFVESCARGIADARATERETKMNDEAWWKSNEELLSRIFEPGRFPLAVRVGSAAGEALGGAYDPEHAYRFGLARVLDGLEMFIAAKSRTKPLK